MIMEHAPCEFCGKPLVPHKGESKKAFSVRRFCNMKCFGGYRSAAMRRTSRTSGDNSDTLNDPSRRRIRESVCRRAFRRGHCDYCGREGVAVKSMSVLLRGTMNVCAPCERYARPARQVNKKAMVKNELS